MTGRHRIASVEELSTDGDRVIGDIDGVEVAVFRIDGGFYALANFCPHQAGPLCEGRLVGRISGGDGWQLEYDDDERNVACPWHAWTFDVTTGENLQTDRYRVPTFDVEVEDGEVFVIR
jgi:nitrite reductase/ring-hydroxylating ferredoxin subunit